MLAATAIRSVAAVALSCAGLAFGGTVVERLDEPVAIAAASDGALYACEAGAHRVAVIDRGGRVVRRFGAFGRGNGAFDGPRGIAVGDDGLVYVADSGNHRVQVFDREGRFVRAWGGFGDGAAEFDTPVGIAVRGGRVAVADTRHHRVSVFDRAGHPLFYAWSHGTRPGAFDLPVAVALEADGGLFVVDQGNGRVQHLDADGRFVAAWGARGREGELTVAPSAIAGDDASALVADPLSGRLVEFARDGSFAGAWRVPGIDDPGAVARLPGERIAACSAAAGRCAILPRAALRAAKAPPAARVGYVAGGAADRLVLAAPDSGALLLLDLATTPPRLAAVIGGTGHMPLRTAHPQGLALAGDGALLVADTGNARLQRIVPGRDPRFAIALGLDDPEQLPREPGAWPLEPAGIEPGALAVTNDGGMVIADLASRRVVTLDRTMRPVAAWGGFGDVDGRFRAVRALALDAARGLVYVLDGGRRRVGAFTRDGRLVAAWGSYGDGAAQFREPVALTLARDGSVLVLDRARGRIARFDPTGRPLGTLDLALRQPEALHVDARGRLVVIDSGHARGVVATPEGRVLAEFPLDPARLTRVPGDDPPAPAGTAAWHGRATTADGRYVVQWEASPDPPPEGEPFALGVRVLDAASGELAREVVLDVDATMPEHRHGMTVRPVVRAIEPVPGLELPAGHGAIGNGQFSVRGMLFHMGGHWRLHFDVTHGAVTRRADADVALD